MAQTIVLITTGGTISTRDDGAGAIPRLGGDDLLRLLSSHVDASRIDVVEFDRIPGCEMTPRKMGDLALRVRRELAREDCLGVAVTHGTDTIEESAFVCHLTIASDKPVVFTGSMRTASDLSWDGPRNLLDAIRVAKSPAARGVGTLLVMNEEIHSARFVTKRNGLVLGAFGSPATGPLGRIYNGEPFLFTRPARRPPTFEPQLDESVAMVRAFSGDDASLREALARPNLHGLIVDGFGSGRVPSAWMSPLRDAIERGVVVALTSRTGSGAVGDSYGYGGSATNLQEIGAIAIHELPSHKARLLLMLALGNGWRGADLRQRLAV